VVPAQKLASTPFVRFGNWPFLGAVLFGIALALVTRTRKPKSL
jgi:apolipoprotein N-acyltransferase